MEEKYERRHAEVWPELIAALKTTGFSELVRQRRGVT
jgi:L-rhamnose mutarotase